ncbi:MAG: hypothetical protein Q8O87_00650 [bacterium]|nr:hypothetical protein [bacterium]
MLVISIHGIPGDTKELEVLAENIVDETMNIEGLEVLPDHISVFFIAGLPTKTLGKEIIVYVNGLFANPERTLKVRKALAERTLIVVALFASDHIKKCRSVKVFINQFNPKNGFATISLQEFAKKQIRPIG